MNMNQFELEWLVRDRLDRSRAYAARQALIRRALADRPALRVRLGTLLIRLGTWLRRGVAEADVEGKHVAA